MRRISIVLIIVLVFMQPWRGFASALFCVSFAQAEVPCFMPGTPMEASKVSKESPSQTDTSESTKDVTQTQKCNLSCCQIGHFAFNVNVSDHPRVVDAYDIQETFAVLDPPPEWLFKPPIQRQCLAPDNTDETSFI